MLDVVASLIDQSLLTRASGDDARIEMLETIREYAREQLAASGELDQTQERHGGYFLELAERLRFDVLGFYGLDSEGALLRPEDLPAAAAAWIATQLSRPDLLTADHDNFRIAIDWAAQSGRRDVELGLVGILWNYWWYRGDIREGLQRLDAALRRASAAAEPALFHALHVSLVPLLMGGHYDQALRHVVQAHELAVRIGDDVRAPVADDALLH